MQILIKIWFCLSFNLKMSKLVASPRIYVPPPSAPFSRSSSNYESFLLCRISFRNFQKNFSHTNLDKHFLSPSLGRFISPSPSCSPSCSSSQSRTKMGPIFRAAETRFHPLLDGTKLDGFTNIPTGFRSFFPFSSSEKKKFA